MAWKSPWSRHMVGWMAVAASGMGGSVRAGDHRYRAPDPPRCSPGSGFAVHLRFPELQDGLSPRLWGVALGDVLRQKLDDPGLVEFVVVAHQGARLTSVAVDEAGDDGEGPIHDGLVVGGFLRHAASSVASRLFC